MTAREHREILFELARRASLDKIRQHHDQRAPLLMARQRLDQHAIVRLEWKRTERQRRANDPADAAETRLGARENAQLAIERDEADPVAVLLRRARQRNRAIDRVIELRCRIDLARHQAAGVDRDHHRVMTLGLMLPDDEPAAARARMPIDMTRIVAGDIFAQRFELGALAARRDADGFPARRAANDA